MNKVKINEYVYEESLIDNFFIGKGRFYVEDERVNTKDEAMVTWLIIQTIDLKILKKIISFLGIEN